MSEDLAGLGIWLVGYPAPKTNWGGIALALPDRADNILARLLVEPRLAKGNIIFVVHSLGGLVVEQLLRSADRDATSDSRAEEFLSRVRRIAFLGTPHRGAILANIAVALRLLLLRPSAATRDLLLGSPQLRELNRWYRKKSQTSGIEHLVLAEGRPEKLFGINLHEVLGKIVWSDSADPGLPELSVTVDESHTNICKPASRDAEVYVLVKEFIARPFAAPRMEPMAQAVESNTRQLKQLTTQSQEQTMAIEAFKRTVESRPLGLAMDTAIIDAEVARQTERLRKCRFFAGVNTIDDARRLAEHGDPISRVGAVEVALSHLDRVPELGPIVERIVEALLSDDPEDDGCAFALLCAMVVMTASELARKRTLGNVPPFYFRQAAIAHASILIRAVHEARINVESVTRWAQAMGVGKVYFLQGLIDLRREPRWLPDFVGSNQLRFEFIGRIKNAAGHNEGKIQLASLRKLLLGPDSKLAQAAQWPFPHLPGPMEGAIASGRQYPDDFLRETKTALEADRLQATAFAGLVNGALLFDMQKGVADLAAAALRRVSFSLEDTDDKGKNFSLVAGLATLAAVTRSGDLADAIRVLVRVMRRRKRLSGDLDEELRIALVTAASFEGLEEWARFAGEWLTEIAFETSDKTAAKAFLPKLRRMVMIEPALAKHCASADAALDAFTH